MIDVKQTIRNTIVSQINEMRFHAHNDPKCWRKLMYLTMLDDLYDWSYYRDDKTEIQLKLKELRTDFILNNPMFGIARNYCVNSYNNVNTPQTNEERWRLFDKNNVIYVTSGDMINKKESLAYTPNYKCVQEIVFLPNEKLELQKDPVTGISEPTLKNGVTLTTCEKMNIYIDSETKEAFYLTPEGIWQKLSTSEWTEDSITKLIKEKEDKGVAFEFNILESGTEVLTLDTPEAPEEYTATIPVITGDNEYDLNDVL